MAEQLQEQIGRMLHLIEVSVNDPELNEGSILGGIRGAFNGFVQGGKEGSETGKAESLSKQANAMFKNIFNELKNGNEVINKLNTVKTEVNDLELPEPKKTNLLMKIDGIQKTFSLLYKTISTHMLGDHQPAEEKPQVADEPIEQSDNSDSLFTTKNGQNITYDEIDQMVRNAPGDEMESDELQRKYNLDDEELNQLIDKYHDEQEKRAADVPTNEPVQEPETPAAATGAKVFDINQPGHASELDAFMQKKKQVNESVNGGLLSEAKESKYSKLFNALTANTKSLGKAASTQTGYNPQAISTIAQLIFKSFQNGGHELFKKHMQEAGLYKDYLLAARMLEQPSTATPAAPKTPAKPTGVTKPKSVAPVAPNQGPSIEHQADEYTNEFLQSHGYDEDSRATVRAEILKRLTQ